MLNLADILDTVAQQPKYLVKCYHCGKFISRKDIEEAKAKFHFVPDSHFGPEESYWEHVKC